MKTGKVLSVLGILVLAGVLIFGITGSVYARQNQIDKRAGVDAADAGEATRKVEGSLPKVDPDAEDDKGSPMHGWKAIVASGKKAGDTITSAEFAGMRNWSASTRGYELKSLVAIGVLASTGKRGEYKVLVDATDTQIDQVNDRAKNIVERNLRGDALGIDSYRLDAAYLGKGDETAGNVKLNQIAAAIQDVTGTVATARTAIAPDFVQTDIDATNNVPASVAINGDISFRITEDGAEITLPAITAEEQRNLLAALVDTRILPPDANIVTANDGTSVSNFQAAEVKTVLFEEKFVTESPGAFKTEFDKLKTDEIAVIIAINKNNTEIKTALEQAGLLGQWGNRIVIMGVTPNSPAAVVFGRLFGDNPSFDLRGKKVDAILNNKDLVAGLAGTV